MPTFVKRTTLIVRDVRRAQAFYRDVLGFWTWYDEEIVVTGRGLAAGNPGDRTRLVIMQAQDPVIGMIGLLQFLDRPLPPARPRERLGIGDVVFVVQTDDVHGIHARAVAFGARIYADPHPFEVTGADGARLKMTSISIWDPDDYFIEVNQRH